MRIAQVSPLSESVPPKQYGGTERVVSYLTDELVRKGHEVTLYASGDSSTTARLIPCAARSLRTDNAIRDHLALHIAMIERVAQEAANFDIIHWHLDYLPFPVASRIATPSVTTLHGRLDLKEQQAVFWKYRAMPVISISDSQRGPLTANWINTVYHGLPPNLYRLSTQGSGYLAFIGRISPEKRLDRAIEIAKAIGKPLKVAAKVDKTDREYFDAEIEPLLDHPLIEFIGEIGDHEKQEFLGNADALLFPIDWCEPFGLVMIEAMACGTPIVAWRKGSVPEIINVGVTGQIVESMDEAIAATREVMSLDRSLVRACFDKRFSSEVMADNYLQCYQQLTSTERLLNAV